MTKNTHGNDQRTADEGDHTPIKSEESHTKTSGIPEKLVDNNIIGGDPADPVEDTECSEQVTGQPEPAETSEND